MVLLFLRCLRNLLAATLVLATISACSEPELSTYPTIQAPGVLSHRMIDQGSLLLEYSVDGAEPLPGTRQNDGSGNFTVTINGAPEDEMTVDFTWLYQITDADNGVKDLPLATYQARIPRIGSQTRPIEIDESSYITTGSALDNDRDGSSNLEEVTAGSDPFNSNLCPDCPDDTDVIITKIREAGRTPGIDGSYDRLWTTDGQFKDKQGELLINNTIIGDITSPAYRWGAMFDEENLYVIVLGRLGANEHFSDSINAFDDESVEIFISPDPREENSIIGDDEYHFIIPITGQDGRANRSGATTARFEQGRVSAMLPTPLPIQFTTCLCASNNDVWEIKIPLNAVGLTAGEHFGFEVQVNLDTDGGPRDARWGWKDQSQDTAVINFTSNSATPVGRALLKLP